jgi:hypothetical protein
LLRHGVFLRFGAFSRLVLGAGVSGASLDASMVALYE